MGNRTCRELSLLLAAADFLYGVNRESPPDDLIDGLQVPTRQTDLSPLAQDSSAGVLVLDAEFSPARAVWLALNAAPKAGTLTQPNSTAPR